jgi:CubicO group peptidase (beta-lactamase class C family)
MTMSSVSRAGLDRLHEAMAARVASGELPGIVTVVAQGQDVHVDTIGAMAFGSDVPLRRDTVFRIASMTKPIIAAATMMLVEDGTLALDEPVDRLLPELADRRVLRHVDGPLDDTVPANRPITVEDLLTFRMGHGQLLEPTFDPPFPIVRAANDLQLAMGPPDPRTPHGPDRWIELFGTLPLMYQPGERWQYNTAALVLGVLVARAARRPLEAFLRARIFEPLGMDDTGFCMPPEHADRLPVQYGMNFGTGQVEPQTLTGAEIWTIPPSFPSGAGGLLSTADDFLAFARLLLDKGRHGEARLLTERSVELMTTNHLTPAQITGGGVVLSGSGWGFGMAVTVTPDDTSPTPGLYGWAGGYGSAWFNDPHTRRIGIALTQSNAFLFQGALLEFEHLASHA